MEEKIDHDIPTLAAWAGGETAFAELTKAFYSKVTNDELLGPIFKNMPENHSMRVANFIVEVFQGPKRYTEQQNGSHANMVAHHIGRNLTEKHRQRWMNLLLETADEICLPNDPEFRSAFVGYLEWGSRLAVLNANRIDNPITDGEPMPQWGWGETGGPFQK